MSVQFLPGIYDFQKSDATGGTFLHEFCREGRLAEIETLIRLSGEKLNAEQEDKNGYRPVHEAALAGHEDILLYLHSVFIVDLNARTKKGLMPLHLAAQAGHFGVVRQLVALGADLNAGQTCTGKTALHFAVESGNIMAVGVLIAAGADVFSRSKTGQTPLDTALAGGYIETARILRKAMAIRPDSDIEAFLQD